MTTTTCTHPCPAVAPSHLPVNLPAFSVFQWLSRLGAWASHGIRTRHDLWRQGEVLHDMGLHQLQDIGAPDWLLQRAASRQAMESYEYTKATSRLKY